MFQRRTPLTFLQNLRQSLWPSMGWTRTLRYYMHRVVRLADTPYRIAGGMAIGASISFTPVVGTHIIQAFIISFVIRTNYLASLIGTIIGNPLTFSFMWYLSYKLGVLVFAWMGMPVALDLPEGITFSQAMYMILNKPFDLILPWMVGGYILAVLTWPLFYVLFFILVKNLKAYQHQRRLKAVHNIACEVTGQEK